MVEEGVRDAITNITLVFFAGYILYYGIVCLVQLVKGLFK